MLCFKRLVLFGLLVTVCLVATADDAVESPVAQAVWVNPAPHQYEILMADYIDDEWGDPVSLYRSENPLAGVALATNAAKEQLLVWSEQRKKKLLLLASIKSGVKGEWSAPVILSDIGSENTGAIAIADLSGKFWVFWASNPNGMDDVYYTSFDAMDFVPTPRRLHDSNTVPDYYPSAQLDESGNIAVSWKTFDLSARGYVIANFVFELDSSQKNGYKLPLSREAEVTVADIVLPNFLPVNGARQLHLPGNTISQSIRLNNGY